MIVLNMGKTKNIVITSLLFLLIPLVGLVTPQEVNAAQFHFKSYSLPKEEIVNEDVYIVGEEIKIEGIIDGDAILIGDVVQLDGTVTGDVYVLGGKVDLNANVYGVTFLLGANSTVEGLLAENTYILSPNINYSANTGKNLLALFVESTIGGSVGGNLRVLGLNTTIDSFVNKDLLVLLTDEYRVEEEKITGEIFDKAKIQEIAKEQGIVPEEKKESGWEANVIAALTGFLGTLLVGFILILLSPVKTYAIKEKITGSSTEFFSSLAVGFVILILIPFPLFVLFLTVVGAPTAFLILGVLMFVLLFGRIWVEMAFSTEVLGLFGVKEYRPYKSLLVGRFISTLLYLVPVVGNLYGGILATVALGAIVRMKKENYDIAKGYSKKEKGKKKA